MKKKTEFTAGADIFWGRAGQYNDNYNYSDIIFLYKTSLINIQFNVYVAKVNIKQRYSFELRHGPYPLGSNSSAAQSELTRADVFTHRLRNH